MEKETNVKRNKLDEYFGISSSGSTIRTEIVAGLVTFLAMCYILTVNPNSIIYSGTSAGAIWSSIFIASAIGAVLGTLLMALVAKMPFAQAPGLGLNNMVGAIIGGNVGAFSTAYHYTLSNALLLVFISGILFLVLSIIPIKKDKNTGKYITLREKIFDGIPVAVRTSISVGIGFFIAFIGMQNSQIIVNNEYTLVQLVSFNTKEAWASGGAARFALVGIISFVIIAFLSHLKVKGAVIIGILVATIISIPLGVADLSILTGQQEGITWKFWENFAHYFGSESEGGVAFIAFTEGFNFPKGAFMTSVMTVISISMIDMFDTMGTVVGCSQSVGLVDENGKPLNYNKMMISDSVATVTGAMLGTTTVTTFCESGTGIAAGGRTGMTSLITAILFFLSIFVLPLFAFIPQSAAAGALIYVGVLMVSNVKEIDFKNPINAASAFVTIITMPLAYSITTGIGLGIITFVVLTALEYAVKLIMYAINKEKYEKPKWQISIVCLVVFALFLIYFLVPSSF